MALSILTPARTVLMIGDEGLYIYDVGQKAARLVDAVPWQADNFEQTVINHIQKTCKAKPVLILNDMTDQHFKGGQRLPKVGIMDKALVLKRRLQVAFPNYPIRGALPIKADKKGEGALKDVKKGGGDLYLFAAVPSSDPVTKTTEAVRKSMASLAGFYLLPVEASDMVKTLAIKLAGKKRPPSRWVVFIGQHNNGALRQVIIRDGQLAMTRMTPVIDTATDHDQWAREVSQEFKATVSYLSRFGFTPEDTTDVIVICNPSAGQALESLIDIPCQYTTFTATEAARELGMSIGVQEEPRYASALHAAWIGRKNRFILPMKADDIDKVFQARQVSSLAILLMICGGAYLTWQVFTQGQNMLSMNSDLQDQKRFLSMASSDYDAEVKRLEALGFDVKLVKGSLDTYRALDSKRLKVLPMIVSIDKALGDEIRLDALNIDTDTSSAQGNPAAPPPASDKPQVVVYMKLSFPPTIDPEAGVQEIANLKRRLETAFPGRSVIIQKNIASLDYSDSLSGSVGKSSEQMAKEDYVAELLIKGDAP